MLFPLSMSPAKKSADAAKKAPAKKPSAAKKAPATKKVAKAPAAPKETKKKVEKSVAAASTAAKVDAAPKAPVAKKEDKAVAEAPKIKGIRIRLSAFDHTVLDETALKIVDAAMRTGAIVHGPIPLPTKIRKFTVNRSTFVHKDARDQFEMRIHRRLIDLTETTFKTVDSLQNLSLPSGVDIEIRMGSRG